MSGWTQRGVEVLLDLNDVVLAVDKNAQYSVKFCVTRVEPTPEKPHGLNYSLTLHGPDGRRLVGFDNAHPIRESRGPAAKSQSQAPLDHKHRMENIRRYHFTDAATLLEDFWAEVDKFLKEKGVI